VADLSQLNIEPHYRGDWVEGDRYVPGDVVSTASGPFVAIAAPATDDDPTDSSSGSWQPYSPVDTKAVYVEITEEPADADALAAEVIALRDALVTAGLMDAAPPEEEEE
jgi:hypothetical protein